MTTFSVAEIAEQVERVEAATAGAQAAVRGDAAASPVLAAVVDEFNRKARKALGILAGADASAARETIFELEQAGDSANYAAVADPGAAEETKEAVYAAHEMICAFKQALLGAEAAAAV